nr:AAA family ATPase [Gordonia crocea]
MRCAVAADCVNRGDLATAVNVLPPDATQSGPVAFLWGRIALAEERYQQALGFFVSVRGRGSFSLQEAASLSAAQSLLLAGDHVSAERRFGPIVDGAQDPGIRAHAQYGLGFAVGNQGRLDEAKAHFAAAQREIPTLEIPDLAGPPRADRPAAVPVGNRWPVGDETVDDLVGDETVDEVLAELNDHVGQHHLKREIEDLVALVSVEQERRARGLSGDARITQHMVFAGPPGTGKTTVARLVGRLYKALGVLAEGHVVEVDRADLVGEVLGSPQAKTTEVLDKAQGGILLIDEAYTHQGEGYSGGDVFGDEVIALLLKRMEDARDEFVVIATGYSEEMEEFLEANPGLRSRFSTTIHFEPYGPAELVEIATGMAADKGYALASDASEALHAALADAERRGVMRLRSFGNARLVRNVIEKAERKQARRLASLMGVGTVPDAAFQTFVREDIEAAVSDELNRLVSSSAPRDARD